MKRGSLLKMFVCSPLRGDVARNVALCKKLCHAAVLNGYAAWAPHLFYPLFLNDDVESERELGIACGVKWMGMADVIGIFADDDSQLSAGMKIELDRCEKFSLPPTKIWMPEFWAEFRPELDRIAEDRRRGAVKPCPRCAGTGSMKLQRLPADPIGFDPGSITCADCNGRRFL